MADLTILAEMGKNDKATQALQAPGEKADLDSVR